MKGIKKFKDAYRSTVKRSKRLYLAKRRLARRRLALEIWDYNQAMGKSAPVNPPKRGLLEEIGNSVTHGLGAAFAILSFVLMLSSADRAEEIASAVIYSMGLFIMFSNSCLYHSFKHGSAVKRLFRRFDYSSIYLLIGATFAPSLLCVVGGRFGWIFFAVQWSIIAAGISLVGVFGPTRLRFIHIPMYVALGWSALMLMPWLLSASVPLAVWILVGGIVYTLGIIPFTIKLKSSHFIWHFFVLAGAVVQWIGIYLYIYLS